MDDIKEYRESAVMKYLHVNIIGQMTDSSLCETETASGNNNNYSDQEDSPLSGSIFFYPLLPTKSMMVLVMVHTIDRRNYLENAMSSIRQSTKKNSYYFYIPFPFISYELSYEYNNKEEDHPLTPHLMTPTTASHEGNNDLICHISVYNDNIVIPQDVYTLINDVLKVQQELKKSYLFIDCVSHSQ